MRGKLWVTEVRFVSQGTWNKGRQSVGWNCRKMAFGTMSVDDNKIKEYTGSNI